MSQFTAQVKEEPLPEVDDSKVGFLEKKVNNILLIALDLSSRLGFMERKLMEEDERREKEELMADWEKCWVALKARVDEKTGWGKQELFEEMRKIEQEIILGASE